MKTQTLWNEPEFERGNLPPITVFIEKDKEVASCILHFNNTVSEFSFEINQVELAKICKKIIKNLE